MYYFSFYNLNSKCRLFQSYFCTNI